MGCSRAFGKGEALQEALKGVRHSASRTAQPTSPAPLALSSPALALARVARALVSHSSGSLARLAITVLALVSSLLSICCAVCLNGLCTLRTFQFQWCSWHENTLYQPRVRIRIR